MYKFLAKSDVLKSLNFSGTSIILLSALYVYKRNYYTSSYYFYFYSNTYKWKMEATLLYQIKTNLESVTYGKLSRPFYCKRLEVLSFFEEWCGLALLIHVTYTCFFTYTSGLVLIIHWEENTLNCNNWFLSLSCIRQTFLQTILSQFFLFLKLV